MDKHRHEARAAGTERVAQRDRAAVHVDLRRIELQLIDAHDGLARERLVELDEVEIIHGQAGSCERLLCRWNRAYAHNGGIHARDGRRDHSRKWLHPQGARPIGLDQQHRRRPVIDARRVPGRHRATVAERRLQRGEGLLRRVRPRVLVPGHHDRVTAPPRDRHGNDLRVEPPRLDGRHRPPLALQREPILEIAPDLPALRDVLGRFAHRVRVVHRRQPGIREAPAERGVEDLAVAAVERLLRLGHHVRGPRHRLDPTRHEHVAIVDRDGVCRRVDRLEAAPAQPIDRLPSDFDRQSREQERHSRHVSVVLAGLVRAAQDHVLDERRVDARSVHDGPNDDGPQVVRPDG